MNSDSMTVFEKAPIPKAVLKNAIPAMAAMLMVLIYNLADTFFMSGGAPPAPPQAYTTRPYRESRTFFNRV